MKISQFFTTVFPVRINKLGTSLAVGALATGLLLGTSLTQAAEVIVDGSTVIRIENLEVFDDQDEFKVYDVDFRFETASDVYGQDFEFFPFIGPDREEEVFAVLVAINNALDAKSPVPSSAGIPSQDTYYIGIEEDAGAIAAGGGEFILSGWEQCQEPNCIGGAAVLESAVPFTYADLTEVTDGDPPPTAGSLFKQVTCPAWNETILSAGERIGIDDIVVSANQDQVVTLKFNPPDLIVTKLSMKAKESAVVNISGIVESLDEQSLRLDCSGEGNLFITVVGSKAGL